MIKTRKKLKEILIYEKKNYGSIPKAWFILSLFGISEKSIIWKYQINLRKWEFHLNNSHKIRSLYYKFKTLKLGYKYGIHIPPNCFGRGLKIMHLGPILINSNSQVGENCVLHINTSMVATNGSGDAPILGNNCALGVGSTLIGGIRIGNNVVVGAGAIVNKSFTENYITLGGVPAKVISRNAII